MDIPKKDQTYVLVTPERLENLVKTNFMLGKSVMLFEYLCSQSKYPMYLSARAACEILGISAETLIACRHQRLIRPKRHTDQVVPYWKGCRVRGHPKVLRDIESKTGKRRCTRPPPTDCSGRHESEQHAGRVLATVKSRYIDTFSASIPQNESTA